MWECGLKFYSCLNGLGWYFVTPLVGVWIEMIRSAHKRMDSAVTPLVGVWIEIQPIWKTCTKLYVTPLVGVWIEIYRRC